MERKDYEERFMDVKKSILDEISHILPKGAGHYFKDKFSIHYIEGEVATHEQCLGASVSCDGNVVICVYSEIDKRTEFIDGESIYLLAPSSLLDILDHLKKEIREKKLSFLREMVQQNEGSIEFDGEFKFTGYDFTGKETLYECEESSLLCLHITDDGHISVRNEWQGCIYDNSENLIPDSELDRLIEYVKQCNPIALIDEQKKAVDEFIDSFKALKKMGVCIIRNQEDSRLYFINGNALEDIIPVLSIPPADESMVDITMWLKNSVSCESIITTSFYDSEELVFGKF